MKRWMLFPLIVLWIACVPLNWYAFGPIGAAVYEVLWVVCYFAGKRYGEWERGER